MIISRPFYKIEIIQNLWTRFKMKKSIKHKILNMIERRKH